MRHQFEQSSLAEGFLTCKVCRRNAKDHGPKAICEGCQAESSCDLTDGNILLCDICLGKRPSGELQMQTLGAHQRIESSREIDSKLRIQTDIFNAKTVAIHELKTAIDTDPEIKDKHFTLARVLDERFKLLSDILFSKRKEITEGETEQRAIQTFYNELAKRLKDEEREQLRLKDVQYKPLEPKVVMPKKISVKKYDKTAIREAAVVSKLPEALIQMTCVARNVTPAEAVRILQGAAADNSGTL